MKSTALFFTLIFSCALYSTAQLADDFADGNFTYSPSWTGDSANFTINSLYELQLNDNSADTSILTTSFIKSSLDSTEWRLSIRQNFSPSGSNYGRVYLVSDQNNLKGPLNGYFLQFGEVGSQDAIELFRQQGTNITSVCRGTASSIASSFSVTVKVTRDHTGFWNLYVDYAGGNNYLLDASGMDAAINSCLHLGVYCKYTISNSTSFFFDDFYAGPIIPDTILPTVIAVSSVDPTTVKLLFSEPPDSGSAVLTTNYLVDKGIGNPAQVKIDSLNSRMVELALSPSLLDETYHLLVTGIQDNQGNTMDPQSLYFSWTSDGNPAFRKVVINELMADPSPQVALPVAEYVEIFNADTVSFSLSEWQISDGSSTLNLPEMDLAAGDYLILCNEADTSAFSVMGNVLGLASLPTLNNGGDSISLVNAFGQTSDFVKYDLSWYGDPAKDDGGWSLEQINPWMPCSGKDNWQASDDPNGGTPGFQNSIFSSLPDKTPPSVIKVISIASDEVELTFSESIKESLFNGNFQVSGGIIVTQITSSNEGYSVLLKLSQDIIPGNVYQVSVSGLSDCSGNKMNPVQVDFGEGVKPDLRDVIITEFFPNPNGVTALPEAEFVEIYNRSQKVIDLSGSTISDGSGRVIISDGILLPDQHAIVVSSIDEPFFSSYGKVLPVSKLPSLNNSGDLIEVRGADSLILHQINYSKEWYQNDVKSEGGWSIEMIDPNNPCGGIENWGAAVDPGGGTPGKPNSVYRSNPDNEGPYIKRAIAVSPDSILIWFSEYLDSASVTNTSFTLTPEHAEVLMVEWESFGPVLIRLNKKIITHQEYTINCKHMGDCVGNATVNSSARLVLPEPGIKGDIIINEVLFNPRTGGSDFVELYNHSEKYINLKNWKLGNKENDTLSNIKVITEDHFVLAPGKWVVLTKDTQNIIHEYPKVSRNFIQMENLPSYNNDQGCVILITSDDSVSELFQYHEDMHFALLKDFKGVSLERVNYAVDADESTNWHSASHSEGYATPGYKNSQFISQIESDFEIHLEPKIFSPDNDGFQDLLSINYAFLRPGNMVTISIFNDQGIRVRALINNKMVGISGSVTWDGLTDFNEKVPVGIYVILVEYFRPDGTVNSGLFPVVVAAHI